MSDPQHATYSRYIHTRDGRVYGYLFTDSEGSQWCDLLPGRGSISHRHHTVLSTLRPATTCTMALPTTVAATTLIICKP